MMGGVQAWQEVCRHGKRCAGMARVEGMMGGVQAWQEVCRHGKGGGHDGRMVRVERRW